MRPIKGLLALIMAALVVASVGTEGVVLASEQTTDGATTTYGDRSTYDPRWI